MGDIAWNTTLVAYAQNYAEKKQKTCEMVHSNGPYGENLAEAYDKLDGVDAVKFWGSEKPNYDHKSNRCVGGECGHYTQIVWSRSTQVGCASVKCKNNWVFFICNYSPQPGSGGEEGPY